MYQNFIIPYLYEAQHVSDDTSLIIRSLKLHWHPLVLHRWKAVWTCIWWTLSGTYCAWQRLRMKIQRLPVQFRLLMMGGVSPKTCWASYKYGIIKFWYVIASCWIFLYKFYYDARIHERQALTLRRLMSYIYGAPIPDVSRSHTTTQHSR